MFGRKVRGEGARKVVRETTIDHEIGAYGLPDPYLIKLDTHGCEVPMLCGATETLSWRKRALERGLKLATGGFGFQLQSRRGRRPRISISAGSPECQAEAV